MLHSTPSKMKTGENQTKHFAEQNKSKCNLHVIFHWKIFGIINTKGMLFSSLSQIFYFQSQRLHTLSRQLIMRVCSGPYIVFSLTHQIKQRSQTSSLKYSDFLMPTKSSFRSSIVGLLSGHRRFESQKDLLLGSSDLKTTESS